MIYHYVVVRKDLPFGVALSQVVHAAGESVQGMLIPSSTHAVVLAVPDEEALLRIEAKLLNANFEIMAIREPDEPYFGQITAIGIRPQVRDKLKKLLSNLPLYK